MRRSRRRRTSRVLVFSLIGITSLGGFAAVRKFRQSRETPAQKPAPIALGNKTTPIKVTPASTPAPAPVSHTQTPIKQQEIGLKPLLQVTETPTGAAKATPPTVASIVNELPRSDAAREPAPSVVAPPPQPRVTEPPVATTSSNPTFALASAKSLFDRGELLAARFALNDHFVRGTLPANDVPSARDLLVRINDELIFGRKIYREDANAAGYSVRSGELLQTIARNYHVTWELLCRVNGLSDPRRLRAGQTLKVVKGPFHAVVYKSTFVMDVFLGSPGEPGALFVTSFPVGLGKDDSTPTGKWLVEPSKKIKNPVYYSPRGEGIFDADDPKNPLGEFWIALTGLEGQAVGKLSYGIHGTIDPDSIGKEESMGCIRLRDGDIDRVFELLVDGKSIVTVKE